jgi:hypothetical protein
MKGGVSEAKGQVFCWMPGYRQQLYHNRHINVVMDYRVKLRINC